ncbi:MAG: hypothetical protein HY724_06365 [Candidatus Rokubacteria bacterium]|nr:hypothetical protein [Candidatus Rokubacteria bacterium]
MNRAWIGLLMLLGLALVGVGCYNAQLKSQWVRGAQLSMGVGALRMTDEVIYTQEGQSRVIRPAEGQTLVAVPLRLRNDRTGKALLFVDQDAAVLTDTGGRRYTPVDPFARAAPLEGPSDEKKVIASFLWGEISLDQNYQISGWLVFETPPGREWQDLEWRQGDTIVARFQGPR